MMADEARLARFRYAVVAGYLMRCVDSTYKILAQYRIYRGATLNVWPCSDISKWAHPAGACWFLFVLFALHLDNTTAMVTNSLSYQFNSKQKHHVWKR